MTLHGEQIRVLHVVSSTDRRGAESAAVDLNRALTALGQAGDVVALTQGSMGGLDIPVLGRSRFASRTLLSLRAASRKADVVVAHGSSTLPAVAAATVASSPPFVYRSIGDPRSWLTTPSRRARVRLAVGRASGVVALWGASALFWHQRLGVRPELVEVIPNGVDSDLFPLASDEDRLSARRRLDLPADSPIVLCMGSLSPEKRVDVAIRAAALIAGAFLLVAGEGGERIELEGMARGLLGSRVLFTGLVDRPWEALAASDVVVIPSDTEGQPAVAIEAGMTGRPVVATAVGGLPEIVRSGVTGVLVDAGDPDALARGISDALANRDALGSALHRHCKAEFDLRGIGRKWQAFLQRAIT